MWGRRPVCQERAGAVSVQLTMSEVRLHTMFLTACYFRSSEAGHFVVFEEVVQAYLVPFGQFLTTG